MPRKIDKDIIRPDLDPGSSVVYMALSVLCSNQNSLVPELLYLFSPRQLVDFIKIYGGETLQVPSSKEFSLDLLTALASYHIMAENKSWEWFEQAYHVDKPEVKAIKLKLGQWWSRLTPDEVTFIESLKHHHESMQKKQDLGKMATFDEPLPG